MEEEGRDHGAESVCYAVHRIDLARSRHGISVSGKELDELPVTRFQASPGMAFFKVGSKIVGVTDQDACVVEAESVVIDACRWEVSPGPPPSSTQYGLVGVSGKIYAADIINEDPRCEVLSSMSDASAGWAPLPRLPFGDRILSLVSYPPRRGLLVSTDNDETFLLDGRRRRRAAWVALPGSAPLPLGERAVYAKDHDLWFEVSPRDGRLRAHDVDVVTGAAGEAELRHETHRVSDPIPVVTLGARGGAAGNGASRFVYLGSCKFCAVQAADEGAGRAVTLTVFRVIDSEMPVALAERRRRRRREHIMNSGWLTDVLERACADETPSHVEGGGSCAE